MTQLLLIAAGTSLATLTLTAVVRRYALTHSLIDIPNARSSHKVPTPRGGGLAIVCTVLPALAWAASHGSVSGEFIVAVAGGGLLTAGIGWLDDHRSVSPPARLVAHFAAAIWALAWLGGLDAVRAGPVVLEMGTTGTVLGAIFIVWLINLYNFMDGIDGLAAVETLTVCLGAAILAWMAGATHVAVPAVLLAAANAGFLVWNWAPARIFLGDVGSGFLGYLLAVTAVYSERSAGPPLLIWAVLLGVFIMDATATLVRRLLRGHAVFSAHRLHAYQRAVQSGYTHANVTTAVALINVLLLGLALLEFADARLLGIILGSTGLLLGFIYHRVERRLPM
jgi:Fuc2NAc and GlcNAc transferase